MNRKNAKYWISAGILFANVLFGFYLHAQESMVSGTSQTQVFLNLDSLVKTMQLLRKVYVDADKQKISPNTLLEGALKGMVESLNDPYSNYFNPKQKKAFNDEFEGAFGGIGIQYELYNGVLYVLSVMPNSPSLQAGLHAGDVITAIDDVPVSDMEQQPPFTGMRGPVDSTITLTVLPGGKEPSTKLTLTRKIIQSVSVTNQKILPDTTIGYVKILEFTARTPKELQNVLQPMIEEQSVTGLILDLRDNGGGSVDAAVNICSMFLNENTFIISMEARDPNNDVILYSKPLMDFHVPDSLPVVLLTNQHSASSSEITAGCLRAHGRAKLVGQKTFGKGCSQSTFSLPNGGAIKLTTNYWYVEPKDVKDRKSIHHVGITPDVVITPTEEQKKAMKDLTDTLKQQLSKDGLTPYERFSLRKQFETQWELIDPDIYAAVQLLTQPTQADSSQTATKAEDDTPSNKS